MPTTDEILEAAKKVGQQVDQHESATRLKDALTKVESDTQAQQLIQDLNTHMNALTQKQQAGNPIEVDDKRKMQDLQQKVATNTTLRDFQQAQMDYVDLLRQVDQKINEQSDASKGVPGGHQGSSGAQATGAESILTGMGG